MNKLHSLKVSGQQKTWLFDVEVDPRYLDEWRADGLEINEVVNTVPLWVARWRLVKPWCFCQSLLFFKNPFS